jgi:hypothetical protein
MVLQKHNPTVPLINLLLLVLDNLLQLALYPIETYDLLKDL